MESYECLSFAFESINHHDLGRYLHSIMKLVTEMVHSCLTSCTYNMNTVSCRINGGFLELGDPSPTLGFAREREADVRH